ncbi:MAG: hypothetical protein EB830_05555, partial [Nitrosopumilus sp. H13]
MCGLHGSPPARLSLAGGGVQGASLLAAAILILSGIEYAQAQTPMLDTGAPLYMKSVDPVTEQCSGTSTGTITLTGAGLVTSHTVDSSSTLIHLGYIEINAMSTDKSIAVFNYGYDPNNRVISATIPLSALETITDDINAETFTTRPIFSTITASNDVVYKFVNNTAISGIAYATFHSYGPTLFTMIVPNGVDTIANSNFGLTLSPLPRHATAPNPVLCSTGSAATLPHYFVGFTIPIMTCSPEERTTAGTVTASGLLNLDGSMDISIKDFS